MARTRTTVKRHNRKGKPVRKHSRKVKTSRKRSLDPKEIEELTFQATKDITKKPMSPDILDRKTETFKYDFVPGKGLVRKRMMLEPYGEKTFRQKVSSMKFGPRDDEYVPVGMTYGMRKDLRKKGLLD